MTRSKLLIPLCALMFVMGALFFTVPAYAGGDSDVSVSPDVSADSGNPDVSVVPDISADSGVPDGTGEPGATETAAQNLTVDAVWLTGDTLHIEVTDKRNGVNQTLEVPLSEYAGNSEYVSVQAVDKSGNLSNTIQFKNPFYTPGADVTPSGDPDSSETSADGAVPLTPDGSGTVVDNVTEEDGKEFFSVETADGNVFYLIVDRQRNADNVYLLNAVTENDLASLAKPGDGISGSGVPAQTSPAPSETPDATVTPEPSEPPAESAGALNGGTLIFILIAAVAVGGAGYYFKILHPKKLAAESGADEFEDDPDYDGDYDDTEDGEEGGEIR